MIIEKHIEEVQIHSFQTNQDGEAKVSALIFIMLEAAWAHATKLDWGYENLKNNQMFWALSRIRIEIKQLPRWQDRVILETWPSGNDRMFAYREFRLKDMNGVELLRSNSAWVVLNLLSHKIVSFSENNFPQIDNEIACAQPKRLRYKLSEEELVYLPIKYSDIDVNGHFNSVRAFERIIDAYETVFLQQHQLELIEINFAKEGFVDQEIAVSVQDRGDLLSQSALVRKDDGEFLSIYEMQWKKL
ncbi:MAG: acyl-[acyl-carrier-protein] thioesterase [Mangrovibacterium sp.]